MCLWPSFSWPAKQCNFLWIFVLINESDPEGPERLRDRCKYSLVRIISWSTNAKIRICHRMIPPLRRETSRVDFALKRFHNFGERLGTKVAPAAMAYGNSAGFGLFGPDDEHIRNFLELGVADFGG